MSVRALYLLSARSWGRPPGAVKWPHRHISAGVARWNLLRKGAVDQHNDSGKHKSAVNSILTVVYYSCMSVVAMPMRANACDCEAEYFMRSSLLHLSDKQSENLLVYS
jgi:hypothetical protein